MTLSKQVQQNCWPQLVLLTKTLTRVAVCCVLFYAHVTWADDVNNSIATIDPYKILSESELAKKAYALYQEDFQASGNELKRLESTIKTKSDELDNLALTMTNSQLRDLRNEIDLLSSDLKYRQQKFLKDRNDRRRSDIQRILVIATKAVRIVAEREHIDMVLQNFVFSSPAIDITNKVIAVMDLQTEPDTK